MKKFFIVLLSFGLLICATCQDKVSLDDEKKAIMKILLAEGKLFSNFDLKGLAALHITDESATRYNGTKVFSGWDEIETLLKSYMDRNREFEDSNAKNEKENVVIKVTGNSAWVICDNIWKWEENGQTHSDKNKHIAFLEKIEGKWKFAFNAFVPIAEQKK